MSRFHHSQDRVDGPPSPRARCRGNKLEHAMPETLLAELPEGMATGAIADIYDEIRRFSGVPYVSSLQRYLATMPGVLEWAWAAIRPAMVSGIVPETGWKLANNVRMTPLPP